MHGKITNMTNIAARPEDVAVCLVPGHSAGDVILGSQEASAVGTLVECTPRFFKLLLVRLITRKAELTASALSGALMQIPPALRQTLT